MKNALLSLSCFLTGILLFSCEDEYSDSYSYQEPTIYSSSDDNRLTEIMFFIKPYMEENGQKKYILTDTLYNISVKINNRHSFLSQSFPLDTIYVGQKETVGRYRTTTENIHYPVIVNVQTSPENFDTAGQYADLLNNYFTLSPGNYVCEIKSFQVKERNGNPVTIYTPTLSFPLEVKDNVASTNLGEFEVLINQ